MGDATGKAVGSYEGPGVVTPGSWDEIELLDAKRNGVLLDTIYPGMSGHLLDIRDVDVVLQLRFPGVAYIKKSDIKTQPPARFGEGVRVKTPYGNGVVRHFRATQERIDYVVDLVENKFTGSSCAVGFLNPADVKLRSDRTADETIADADAMRSKGNDAFKARDFTAALLSYQASVEALSSYKGKLDDNIRKSFLDCFLKSLGNTAQCFLRQPEPNLGEVINYATEALNLDPSDATGNKSKNLLRRGEAHFRLRNYDEAIEDLKNDCLAKNAVNRTSGQLANRMKSLGSMLCHLQDAQKLLQSAREFRSKEKSKSQKMWAGAFAKAANEEDDTDGKKAVRFTSPNQSTRSSDVPDGSPSVSPDRGESEQRKLFAGATPFHKKHSMNGDEHAEHSHLSSPDSTMLLEEEADVQSSWTPWLLGAGVVALAGAAAFVYASRSSRR